MDITNFIKQKIKSHKGHFIGRHQQAHAILELIGEKVPELQWQMAINKDKEEHQQILTRFKETEKYIDSDMFTTFLDVTSINEDLRKLITIGYETCVLSNDLELEKNVIKRYDDIREYLVNYFMNSDKEKSKQINKMFGDLRDAFVMLRLLSHVTLGGILAEEEGIGAVAWNVVFIVTYPEWNGLLIESRAQMEPAVTTKWVENIKDFLGILSENNKINTGESQKVTAVIDKCLKRCSEVHRMQ